MEPQTLVTIRKKLRMLKNSKQDYGSSFGTGYCQAIDDALAILRKEVHNAARRKKTSDKLRKVGATIYT